MKRFVIYILFVFLFLSAFAVEDISSKATKKIPLEVSDVKWVYLKFPAKVNYVDMGTEDIVAEKVPDVETILRIKSVIPVFDNTTLTAITKDGRIYTFDLNYEQNPRAVAVDMKSVRDTITEKDYINPTNIELSTIRTSHFILDTEHKVLDVAVGIDTIIANNIKDLNNVVIAKSIGEFDEFETTSLHIVALNTRNQKVDIFPCIVSKNDNPLSVNMNLTKDADGTYDEKATFALSKMNEVDMEAYGKAVVEKGTILNNIGVSENKMLFCLRGLFIKDDILMFHLYLQNNSQIAYDVEFIRAYIKNKKKSKKQTSQDDEKVPVYVYRSDETELVEGESGYSAVFFFKRFTVPDKHQFYFEIFERNGGRHLKFTASNREILDAKRIDLPPSNAPLQVTAPDGSKAYLP